VWGDCAIGKRKIEAQAAHLGDQPEGGFFVSRRRGAGLDGALKSARELVGVL
jgi:hypothetical protein